MNKSFSLPLMAGVCVAPAVALAQSPVYPPLTDFNQTAGAEVSYSFASEVSRGSTVLGDLSATHARAGWLGSFRTGDHWSWLGGMEWRGIGFHRPSGSPIPREVHGVAAKLGAEWNLSERWTLRMETDPGLYSDFEDVGEDDFNAPFSLRATYSPSRALTWVLGLNVDVRSGLPVIGGPGVRWRMDRQWSLNFDAGWVVDRRFTFDREDVLLNGDGAAYLQASVLGTF